MYEIEQQREQTKWAEPILLDVERRGLILFMHWPKIYTPNLGQRRKKEKRYLSQTKMSHQTIRRQ